MPPTTVMVLALSPGQHPHPNEITTSLETLSWEDGERNEQAAPSCGSVIAEQPFNPHQLRWD